MVNKKEPWGYGKSFIIAAIIAVCGYLMQLSGLTLTVPSYPLNALMLAVFVIFLCVLYIFDRNSQTVRWLRSVPAAVASITLLISQSLIMGLVPQTGSRHLLGFGNVMQSYPFALSIIFILTVLGVTTLNRIIPFRVKNIPFITNHLGLWITIAFASVGSGDIQRYQMHLEKDRITDIATGDNGTIHPGFSLLLNNFEIKMYDPPLIIEDFKENKNTKLKDYVSEGKIMQLGDYKIEIQKYLTDGCRTESGFDPFFEKGSAPAVYVKIIGASDTSGWVSCGSKMFLPQVIMLNNLDALVMGGPEPESFKSYVSVNGKNNQLIEVNKPLKVNGWKLYQTGYDADSGKYGTQSIVEIIKDPWLIFVYIGVFLMIAGACHMIFNGLFFKPDK